MYNLKNVGIDVGGTNMHMLAYNGEMFISKTVKTGINATKEYIKEEILGFINGLSHEIESLGIALPGLVRDDNYLIVSDVLPNLNGVTNEFFSNNKYNVKFINDVKAATLTESKVNSEASSVAVLMVGTGIALGLVDDQKLFLGSKGFAGEVGYAYVPYKDGLERFDNLCGGAAILKKAKLTAEELKGKLNIGDYAAVKIVKEAGYYFGLLISHVIQYYNPEVIVIGGGVSTYRYFMEEALKVVEKTTLEQSLKSTTIKKPDDIKNIVAKWALLYDLKK